MKITQLFSLILVTNICIGEQKDNTNIKFAQHLKTTAFSLACAAQSCAFAKLVHRLYESRNDKDLLLRAAMLATAGGALSYGIRQSGSSAYNSYFNKNHPEQQKPLVSENRMKDGAEALLAGSGCLVSILGSLAGFLGLYCMYEEDHFTKIYKGQDLHRNRTDLAIEFALCFPTFVYCTYKTGSAFVNSFKKVLASTKLKNSTNE